jgi:hypothetical protein
MHALPVARNGGPTLTARINGASAAHDVVPVSAKLAGAVFCSGTDQRGVPRRQGPARHCDAGAYQFAPPHIVVPAGGALRCPARLRQPDRDSEQYQTDDRDGQRRDHRSGKVPARGLWHYPEGARRPEADQKYPAQCYPSR